MSDKFDRLCALVKRADELRRVSEGAYKTALYERATGSLRITTSDYNREMTGAQKAYARRALEIINAGVEGDAREAANAVRLDAAEKLVAVRRELIASVCFAASDLQVLINELLEPLPAPAEEGERG